MEYKLSNINQDAKLDPVTFLQASDAAYEQQLDEVAIQIIAHTAISPIVFMAGPSGSGKTTTALKLSAHIEAHGARAHTVALDHYFRSVNEETYPRTETGKLDYESPYCLDLALLGEQFAALNRGEAIEIPHYHFTSQRQERHTGIFLQPQPGDVVIFEGIHALNDMFAEIAPTAMRLYISPSADIVDDLGNTVFNGTWMRLCRRILRDYQFRNTSALETLNMWENIRNGEKKNIDPFKSRADLQINSALPYELCVMKQYMTDLLKEIPKDIGLYDEVSPIPQALELFQPISSKLVAPESLIREFMGGGIYKY